MTLHKHSHRQIHDIIRKGLSINIYEHVHTRSLDNIVYTTLIRDARETICNNVIKAEYLYY